jgi:hypothetical protein
MVKGFSVVVSLYHIVARGLVNQLVGNATHQLTNGYTPVSDVATE